MPRVSKSKMESNRKAILDVSSRLFRERGIGEVSVSDLMGAAGLTHGGFYGHFESKDDLTAQACAQAFDKSAQRWKARLADGYAGTDASAGTGGGRNALIEGYLSARSRDNPGHSCPAPAFAADVARVSKDAPLRAAYVDGIKQLLEVLDSCDSRGGRHADMRHAERRQALVDFSTMVGAMILARATAGDPLSDAFLDSAREALRSPVRRAGG